MVNAESSFRATDGTAARVWQTQARSVALRLLKIDDLFAARAALALEPAELSRQTTPDYTRYEFEIRSTPARRIRVVFTVPRAEAPRRFPLVVCIHGHNGNRNSAYDDEPRYNRFGHALAGAGFATIAADVGQHVLFEKQRTLPGERLWDLLRAVDFGCTRAEVAAERAGCAGLSLGGEMAMWLAAVEARIQAAVSAGFLTTLANMRDGHCPCWEVPGFAAHFDIPDIFCLSAPRALECQIGRQEPSGGGFPVEIAAQAFPRIAACYRLMGAPDAARLHIHPRGHVLDVPAALEFLKKHLRNQ